MMKTSYRIFGVAATGVLSGILLSGCARLNEQNPAGYGFMLGPVIFGGVEYYPARPGARYENRTIDYTNQPPPAGGLTFVNLVSTNGIVIRLIDRTNSTNILHIPDLM